MRIAHVTATFPPYWAGTGNVAYHSARVLHQRGHEVTVLTSTTVHETAMAFPFTVERLPVLFRVGNAPLTPSLVRRLHGFDLIHLHYPYIFGTELALLAATLHRTPILLTYHNRLQETHRLKKVLFGAYNRIVEPIALHRAARLLAVRREHVVSLFPRRQSSPRLREVPNGVDTVAFAPMPQVAAREALGLPQGAPVALFVGALDQAHRFKNVDGLLEAFARIRVPDAMLVVVGDGDLRGPLEALGTTLGLGDRVRFLGRRAPEALPEVYSAADVTVLPSTGVESFGMVLIESMACGTPTIASALPGVQTLLEDGRDGRLVPPGDLTELADALEDVLGDLPRARCWGIRGRAKVLASYDWNVVIDGLESVYEEVLAA